MEDDGRGVTRGEGWGIGGLKSEFGRIAFEECKNERLVNG